MISGICHAFNSIPFEKMWSRAKFGDIFKSVYYDEFANNDTEIVNDSIGTEVLTLFLDKQTLLRSDRLTQSKGDWGTFRMGINDIFSSFSMNIGTETV